MDGIGIAAHPRSGMPIIFQNDSEQQILHTRVADRIHDADLLKAYRAWYASPDWIPEFPELVDMRSADMSQVSTKGLKALSDLCRDAIAGRGIGERKTAILAEGDLSYGLARMYSFLAGEQPELVQVFREEGEAIAWLMEDRSEPEAGDCTA